MQKILAAAAFSFIGAPSFAEGYAEHDAVLMFTEGPCTKVMELLDGDEPDPIAVGLEGMINYFASYGMTWGFILGYDTARGGLHEGDKSTLVRLREDCAAAPEKTAFEILESF